MQGPLSRFGDTAANTGTLAALDAIDATANLPVAAKTAAASVAAALFRIILMPIDTMKTTMYVTMSLCVFDSTLQRINHFFNGSFYLGKLKAKTA